MAERRQARKPNEGAEADKRKRSRSKTRRRDDDCGLHVLRVDERVVLDVIVPETGALLTFIRIDGELMGELPVAGQA